MYHNMHGTDSLKDLQLGAAFNIGFNIGGDPLPLFITYGCSCTIKDLIFYRNRFEDDLSKMDFFSGYNSGKLSLLFKNILTLTYQGASLMLDMAGLSLPTQEISAQLSFSNSTPSTTLQAFAGYFYKPF